MTITDVTTQPTEAERFNHILQARRAAYLRDGAPSLAARRNDLHNLKAALIARAAPSRRRSTPTSDIARDTLRSAVPSRRVPQTAHAPINGMSRARHVMDGLILM
jgi:hypothetical protein